MIKQPWMVIIAGEAGVGKRCNMTYADIAPAVFLEPDGMFRAIDTNTYDADCDVYGFFSNSPYGRTPLDAIVDLLDNIEAGEQK